MVEHRKLMSLGASLVVTLPRSWLRANDLKKGEMVSVKVQRDQAILISPVLGAQEKMRELHLLIESDEGVTSLIRSIIAGFLDGYSSIKLTSKSFFTVDQQNAIRDVTSRLYMMIIESEANRIEIETLLDESKTSVFLSIERMHAITYSMCRDILNSLSEPNLGLLRTMDLLESDVDHLMYLILRLIRQALIKPSLASQLQLDLPDCLDIQTLVHRIERVADHLKIIANSLIWLIENDVRIPEETLSTLMLAAEIAFSSYDLSVKGFLSKDVSRTNEIIDKEAEIGDLYTEITPLPSFGDESASSSLNQVILIRESIKKISHYSADIAELTIDRTYMN
jgi:phosphate uptake regulator